MVVKIILLPGHLAKYGKKCRLTRWLFIFYLCFTLFINFGCAKSEVKNINSPGNGIICFGNSITAGSGVSKKQAYPHLLQEMLDYSVINAGRSGEVASDGLRRLDNDVLSHQPLLVIIEFGGNDFLKKLPLSETVNNIRIMTERIQANGAMVAIADVSSGMIMKNYRKSYERLARQTKSIFIPNLLKGIITNPSLKSDSIHPNADGHRAIAERIYQVIKPYLKR
ncbi:MAG: arylesterase [Candidatus Omnitrophota bacterium]|jgi:acyl-CoA thioesterase-1